MPSPSIQLDFTSASLDSRITFARQLWEAIRGATGWRQGMVPSAYRRWKHWRGVRYGWHSGHMENFWCDYAMITKSCIRFDFAPGAINLRITLTRDLTTSVTTIALAKISAYIQE